MISYRFVAEVTLKDFVDNQINPAKLNFSDKYKDNFLDLKPISDVLEELGLTEEVYESALKISDHQDFQIHLKRQTDS